MIRRQHMTDIIKGRLIGHLKDVQPSPDAALTGTWSNWQGNFLAKADCLYGADAGGTKIQSVITDLNGNILTHLRSATPANGGEDVITVIESHMAQLTAQVGIDIVAAGIGLPGAIHPLNGHLERAPNLPGFTGYNIRALLSDRLMIPVAARMT